MSSEDAGFARLAGYVGATRLNIDIIAGYESAHGVVSLRESRSR
jgi:hypothetical protein